MLLLPLKSRSGVDHLQFLSRLTAFALAQRETAGDGGSKGLREAAREGWLLLLSLKLPGFGGELLPRNFKPPLPPFLPFPPGGHQEHADCPPDGAVC